MVPKTSEDMPGNVVRVLYLVDPMAGAVTEQTILLHVGLSASGAGVESGRSQRKQIVDIGIISTEDIQPGSEKGLTFSGKRIIAMVGVLSRNGRFFYSPGENVVLKQATRLVFWDMPEPHTKRLTTEDVKEVLRVRAMTQKPAGEENKEDERKDGL